MPTNEKNFMCCVCKCILDRLNKVRCVWKKSKQ